MAGRREIITEGKERRKRRTSRQRIRNRKRYDEGENKD